MTAEIVSHCRRCGRPCQTGKPDPNARVIVRSQGGGHCPDCAVTAFLLSIGPIRQTLDMEGPKCLKLPHIQQQIAIVLRFTQLGADEINWDTVIAQWDLPWSKAEKGLFE